MKPTTSASASNHLQSEIMTNPTSQRSEALRNALYKGFQGGTSGAMAMAIQVLQVKSRITFNKEFQKVQGKELNSSNFFVKMEMFDFLKHFLVDFDSIFFVRSVT